VQNLFKIAHVSTGLAVPKTVRHFLDHADLIFGIGCSFTESNFAVAMPKSKKIIHATLDPDHLNKDVAATIGLTGDAGVILEGLLAELAPMISKPRDCSGMVQDVAGSSDFRPAAGRRAYHPLPPDAISCDLSLRGVGCWKGDHTMRDARSYMRCS
jgi:thiamine pyrophosphate-dependent acetolactate synthase large subunit-like protein